MPENAIGSSIKDARDLPDTATVALAAAAFDGFWGAPDEQTWQRFGVPSVQFTVAKNLRYNARRKARESEFVALGGM